MGKLNKKGLEKKHAFKIEMKQKQKNMKEILKVKRARLIVRNLSFKVNEENLKSVFQQYGNVENINILTKPDGKLLGCAFVQFKLVQNAAKARHYLNGQTFLGRKIEVEFAKPKDKYKKLNTNCKDKEEIKKEENNIDLSIVKTEYDECIKKENEEETNLANTENNNEDNDSDSSKSECSPNVEISTSGQNEIENDVKKERFHSNDVSEGKTVFIKNVPFSATNEDLKQCLNRYGSVYYALICFDPLTEHSKGTAFVKFRNKEDAEKCMQAGTELSLQGNILDCHPALHKHDLQQREKEKKVSHKDSRNLYLIKEGVILAGTKAAEGVSATDMAKRLQLEQYKTQMLRNLNMYISKTRLIIHNVPPTWNDLKLKTLFKKHSSANAVIKEARIMRDMRNVDDKGIGRSKEYGFVTFSNHNDALEALRSLNNNPSIFSINKRPIVAFSIENKAALKSRERRTLRSKIRNPNSKDYNPDLPKKESVNRNQILVTERSPSTDDIKHNTVPNKFSGVNATPGIKKMRSRYNLKIQAKLHHEQMKKEKKKRKTVKTLAEKKKDFRKQPKQKQNNKNQDDDSFSLLVNKYKQSLKSVPQKISKWYEQ